MVPGDTGQRTLFSLTAPRSNVLRHHTMHSTFSNQDELNTLVPINYKSIKLDPKLYGKEQVRKDASKIILKSVYKQKYISISSSLSCLFRIKNLFCLFFLEGFYHFLCPHILIRYLNDKGFSPQLKLKDLLSPPSITIYPSLINFLMCQYDLSLRDDKTPFENKVPQFFKDVGYEYNVDCEH